MPTPATDLPAIVNTPAHIAQLDAAATRWTTPCADGQMVWRVWGQPIAVDVPVDVAADVAADAASAPVLLLHGGSGSWTHWARNIAALRRAGRCVIAPDLPGFGDSAPLQRGQDADAVPHWLDVGLAQLQQRHALPAGRGCDVVGFSFGGLVAGLFAHQHPAHVRRLVLVGAPALFAGGNVRPVLRPWIHLPKGSAERATAQARNLRSLMLAREDSVDALALWINTSNLERDRLRHRRLARTAALGAVLPQLQMPLWGVWGALDPLVRGVQHQVQPAMEQAPGFAGLHWIAGAGHWVQYEDAAAFDTLLGSILATPVKDVDRCRAPQRLAGEADL